MLQLSKSAKFINECNIFKEKALMIKNEEEKNKILNLLDSLKREVSILDNSHFSLITSGKMSESVQTCRTNIDNIRKKILTIFKENSISF